MRGIDSIEYAHVERDKTQSLEIQIIKLPKINIKSQGLCFILPYMYQYTYRLTFA
jgi:hypothetical protein